MPRSDLIDVAKRAEFNKERLRQHLKGGFASLIGQPVCAG
jgi:hypothetical protein